MIPISSAPIDTPNTPIDKTKTLTLKRTIEHFSKETLELPQEIKESTLYKGLSIACEHALKGEKRPDEIFEKDFQTEAHKLSLQKELEKSHVQAIEKQQALEKDLSRGPSLSL